MPEAYVLLNCELGSEEHLMDKLIEFEGVTEVRGVFGAYDIFAIVKSPKVEMLNEIIRTKIGKMQKIKGSLTLIPIEGQFKISK